MINTEYPPGMPCWIDLGSPDLDAATAFYGGVFGWETHPDSSDDYRMMTKAGKVVAALGRLTEEGARSAWMVYFHTDDAEATTSRVSELGGEVRTPPVDGGEAGRLAQFTDPQGGRFAVWQGTRMPGLELVNAPGSINWTELMTTDTAAASAFYTALLGLDTVDTAMPGDSSMVYRMMGPKGAVEDDMFGGMVQLSADDLPEGRPYWHPVFSTEDCDATLARVREQGGRVTMGPEDAEGVGRLAVCTDRAGAEFVVLRPSEM
ncbi:VOC family protein [Streptomyces sp. NPDC005438]|uniref:VOC family protein n=1 Tax=Streptomyces sp. NPDC005438 TaxID=3156880 RepID=UPI0033B5A631